MTKWAWGVDVRTGLLAVGALSGDREARWWSLDTGEAGRAVGAARLSGIRGRWLDVLLDVPADLRPTAVIVENPTIVRTDFRLLTLCGVVMEAIYTAYGCPVLELTVGEWKKEVVGKGNAGKPEVLERARMLGYRGDSQDEADALCMAQAALARIS